LPWLLRHVFSEAMSPVESVKVSVMFVGTIAPDGTAGD
jgi:hypothetical protein